MAPWLYSPLLRSVQKCQNGVVERTAWWRGRGVCCHGSICDSGPGPSDPQTSQPRTRPGCLLGSCQLSHFFLSGGSQRQNRFSIQRWMLHSLFPLWQISSRGAKLGWMCVNWIFLVLEEASLAVTRGNRAAKSLLILSTSGVSLQAFTSTSDLVTGKKFTLSPGEFRTLHLLTENS